MPIDTELRFELKVTLESRLLPQARSWLRLHRAAFVVAHPPRRVNTLYMDTAHLSCLDANLAGLGVRDKLRLRWYGDEAQRVALCLELKQKDNQLGRKRRQQLVDEVDLGRPWSEILATIRRHADPAFRVLLQTLSQPTLLTRYHREYFVTPDGTIRATIDFDQQAYDQRLTLRPNLHLRLPIPGIVVIEVKGPEDQADRIWDIVAGFPARRTRNSKYAIGLLTALDIA